MISLLLAQLADYGRLLRLDRPIGIYLLLWPTLCALWIAAAGFPDAKLLIIFVAGVVLMRSAGCIVNDFADRKFDGYVERTRERPLITGRVSTTEAGILFCLLVALAFYLVLLTNKLTIALSVLALALASLYPFMKRYTYVPQVVLGAAYSMGIPMAFAAQTGNVPAIAWLLYTANLLWTVTYDTLYAMVDREDDLKIGVKSTAILFGDMDRLMVGLLQLLCLATLAALGAQLGLNNWFYAGLGAAAVFFAYQQFLIKDRVRYQCFNAFLNNHWVGMMLFLGVTLSYAYR